MYNRFAKLREQKRLTRLPCRSCRFLIMTGTARARHKSDFRLSVDQRRSIFNYGRSGWLKSAVMKHMNVGAAAVKRWWPPADGTVPSFEDKTRVGRPRKLSSADVKAMKRQAQSNASLAQIAMRRMRAGKVKASKSTYGRSLKRGYKPLFYKRVREVDVLRPKNKLARSEFSKTFDAVRGPPLVFLDGKVFTLYSGRGGKLLYRWTTFHAKPIGVKGKQLAHLHFYAAVSRGWKSEVHFVPPSPPAGSTLTRSRMNFEAQHYMDVMKQMKKELDAHFKGKDYRIIRDKATQHTKAESLNEFSLLQLPIVKSYPAQSWDINCIEHVWAQLVRLVLGHRARTARGLRRVIQRKWKELPQTTIDKLVAGVPSRLTKIRELNGDWISHCSDLSFI